MEKTKFVKGQLKTLVFGFLSKDKNRLNDLDQSFNKFQKKYPNVTKTQFKDRAEMYKDENPDERWNQFVEEPQKTEEKISEKPKAEKVIKEKELVLTEQKTKLKKEDINELTIISYKKQVSDSIVRMTNQWKQNNSELTNSQKNYLEILEWNAKNVHKFLNVNTEREFREQKLKF